MRIAAIVVTCNRISLLPRALKSIQNQNRPPDFVTIISNSTNENFELEQQICFNCGFDIFQNTRTANYSGALNTAVEKVIQHFGISEDVYFASLDDDDEWLSDYLQVIEQNNTHNYDLLAVCLLRKSATENQLQLLPETLTEKDFLKGNPGICGSNTFIRLTTLLQAGCFDEAMLATVDRDLLVRVFQLKPTYKIIDKHLVTQYTDNNRERVTNNKEKKTKSLKMFYYKYQHLMDEKIKAAFFKRAEALFSVNRNKFNKLSHQTPIRLKQKEICFEGKGDYQFVIGFIVGDEALANRIVNDIVKLNIPLDLVVIINNTQKDSISECEKRLEANGVEYRIINQKEWRENLKELRYGEAFKGYYQINSIPLGRTILHHHLYKETTEFDRPVYWIIDDDISFSSISKSTVEKTNLFELINNNIENTDAIIGSVSKDPPLPFLSTIRGQLIDFLYSSQANNKLDSDLYEVRQKQDYYYDITDLHSDHLETPIYHSNANEISFKEIFSGKSVSRKVFQKSSSSIERIVTQRGPNTLVFNRDLLHYYPVINLSVHHKFARRGDLLWVLLNQIISEKKIIEHTFAIQQNRLVSDFKLNNELEKSAYDIIGYSFNKAFVKVAQEIKTERKITRPKEIFERLSDNRYFQSLLESYYFYLTKRKTRFLINFYRIIGLTKILSDNFREAAINYKLLSKTKVLSDFNSLIEKAEDKDTIKNFISDLRSSIETYSNSLSMNEKPRETYNSVTVRVIKQNTSEMIIEKLKEFIAIPTIANYEEANQSAIDFIFQILKPIGFNIKTEGESPYKQPVIVAKYVNPNSDKKIVLYGHYDVEKIKGWEKWNTPPFELNKKDDRYYCRGIADNKGILLTRLLAIKEMFEKGEALPNILWIIQGEEEVAGQTPFEVIPQHFKDFGSKLYLEETGVYKDGRPVIFYLPKSEKLPEFLDGLNQAIYSNEATFENRHLNKFTKCPFLHNIPDDAYYIGFGPNDSLCNIHKDNESLSIENLEKHKEVFKKFINWVNSSNI